jgi:multidrug efflux pump subunit AcrB
VGILVDDATVEIENVNRNLETGMETEAAILQGASQIAVPAFVSTIAICIVFVPMFFLSGVAKYLFVPLAEAVVFAMLASYFLSRTIVPTMAKYLLKPHSDEAEEQKHKSRNPFTRLQLAFETQFEKLRGGYARVLELCLTYSTTFIVLFFVLSIGSAALLFPWLGEDFFPSVDSGQFLLHVRAPTGTRIEDTADLIDQVEQEIRREIPKKEVVSIIDNIGLPYSGLNLSYSTSAPIGPADADITVSLAEEHHSTEGYVDKLKVNLSRRFPGTTFYTLPVDMVTQILNFGLPAPLDVQVVGQNLTANHDFAEKLLEDFKHVPGATDLRIQQPSNYPRFFVDVDRSKAQDIGLVQKDVASSLLVALSGSFQTEPTFWLDPKNGVSYAVSVQSPQYTMDSLQDVKNIPLTPADKAIAGSSSDSGAATAVDYRINGSTPGASVQAIAKPVQVLGGVANLTRGQELATVSHYDIQPVIDIYGSFAHTDLHSVDLAMEKIIDRHRKYLARGSEVIVRGQVETMATSFKGLLFGLIFSILLVYLLIVVNFQSWLDPFIIIAALPAALSGIVWFLFVTKTHISVPALTGAIMCMGVATANSILVVSFAKEQLEESKKDAREAALVAGFTRFRPVVMTALAMIIGMVPMALGLGDGGEQNAPLGRAVIGGLLFATVATLLFVPTFFSVMHGRRRSNGSTIDETELSAPTK